MVEPIELNFCRSRYEYRTADSFVKDFELMKNNAIKFNGKVPEFEGWQS
jgi:hypothetical protein